GAVSAVFVDDDRAAVAVVRANLDATGLAGPHATVVQSDVLRWVRTAPPVDLVLADPPYSFDRWDDLLVTVRARLLVCESGRDLPGHAGWDVVRQKRYGSTVVT